MFLLLEALCSRHVNLCSELSLSFYIWYSRVLHSHQSSVYLNHINHFSFAAVLTTFQNWTCNAGNDENELIRVSIHNRHLQLHQSRFRVISYAARRTRVVQKPHEALQLESRNAEGLIDVFASSACQEC